LDYPHVGCSPPVKCAAPPQASTRFGGGLAPKKSPLFQLFCRFDAQLTQRSRPATGLDDAWGLVKHITAAKNAALNNRATQKEAIMKAIITLLATAAVFTLTTGTAQARTDTVEASVSVQYSDLDLTKAEGVKTFQGRIARAANVACGGHPGSRELNQIRSFDACRKAAISKAMAALPTTTAPAIAALGHRLRTPKEPKRNILRSGSFGVSTAHTERCARHQDQRRRFAQLGGRSGDLSSSNGILA
jgi:UrcA family protein